MKERQSHFVAAEKEKLIDDFLRESAGEKGAHLLPLLSLAVRKSLRKEWTFRERGEGRLLFSRKEDLKKRISLVLDWLEFEQARKAEWLSRCDSQGRPHRLVNINLDYAYHTALKQEGRGIYRPGKLKIHEDPFGEKWRRFFRQTPDKFFQEMTSGLPAGTNMDVYFEGRAFSVRYSHKKFSFARDFFFSKPEWLEVKHNGADIRRDWQGRGIGRTVNAHMFRIYREMGVKNIYLNAGFVGTYAHARIGFVPEFDDWQEMKGRIEKRLSYLESHPSEKDDPLPGFYVDALRQVLQSDDPKTYWFIVDQEYEYCGFPLGKILTLDRREIHFNGISDKDFPQLPIWRGTLDTADPDCVNRYTAYLFADKNKPQPRPAVLPGVHP